MADVILRTEPWADASVTERVSARERAWLEERRWCRCGPHARPGRTYSGVQTCERCGAPWRQMVALRAEGSAPPPRPHRCGDEGGTNRYGQPCRIYTPSGTLCEAHRT